MIRFLPYHQDQYFLTLAKAVWGGYEPRFDYEGAEAAKRQSTEEAHLDRFSKAAVKAIRRFQDKKARGKRGR